MTSSADTMCESSSQFWRPPLEIRIEIYGLAFGYGRDVLVKRQDYDESSVKKVSTDPTCTILPLNWSPADVMLEQATTNSYTEALLVNKKLYDEAVQMFYISNHFVVYGSAQLLGFASKIQDAAQQQPHDTLHHQWDPKDSRPASTSVYGSEVSPHHY